MEISALSPQARTILKEWVRTFLKAHRSEDDHPAVLDFRALWIELSSEGEEP